MYDVITSFQGVFTCLLIMHVVVWNLLLLCFWVGNKLFQSSLAQSRQNIIGSVRDWGHKMYYFSARSGSGQKIMSITGSGSKNLALLDSSSKVHWFDVFILEPPSIWGDRVHIRLWPMSSQLIHAFFVVYYWYCNDHSAKPIQWHIIIWNRCMCLGLNQYPMVTNKKTVNE